MNWIIISLPKFNNETIIKHKDQYTNHIIMKHLSYINLTYISEWLPNLHDNQISSNQFHNQYTVCKSLF